MESPLSFTSTQDFRKKLISRNLKPYKVEGFYTANPALPSQEITLSDNEVVDSPDALIGSSFYANILYPLNAFGPDGGFTLTANIPNLLNTQSNLGEYDYQDADLPEQSAPYYQTIPGKNRYSSDKIYLEQTEYVQLKPIFETYWSPISFVPSFYTPASILLQDDPSGSDGLLSQDSFIASLGAQELRKLLKDRAAKETEKNTLGIQTLDDNVGNPFFVQNLLSNPNLDKTASWTITRPQNANDANAIFVQKLQGQYISTSPIPGDYFDEDMVQKRPSGIFQTFNAYNLGGTISSAVNSLFRFGKTPSEVFLENTGGSQKSQLFYNLDYNKYKPQYSRGILADVVGTATNALTTLLNPFAGPGGYYLGNRNIEPSIVDTPPGDRPILYNGLESEAIVYGPNLIAQLYENPEGLTRTDLRLLSAGQSFTDGGGIDGGLIWTDLKFGNPGFLAGVGGSQGSKDPDYDQISGQIERDLTYSKNFKLGSILDYTQRIVNSTPQNGRRYQHVGNAINQLSKVFNDGYKEITKGSKVITYELSNGQYVGTEYARVFAKDTPYYTYNDLQKTDGITTQGRKFSYSVLDNTFNLNITPISGVSSTNLVDGRVKKYMFSIENLAWRTSNRPGYTVDDLPVSERGPNGGRIMWFPPYNLKFNDSSTPNFQDVDFLGRPEPIYTYRNTKRSGSISWRMIVDHPSSLNTIIERELGNERNSQKVNDIIDSFMAGAVKFDIYELARKYSSVPTRDLFELQQMILNNPSNLTQEQIIDAANNLPTNNTATSPSNQDTNKNIKQDYTSYAFYFPENISSENYTTIYDSYVAQEPLYSQQNPNGNTNLFFTDVVQTNFEKMKQLASEVINIFNGNANSDIVITLNYGSNQSEQTINNMLDSVRIFFSTYDNSKLQPYIQDSKLRFKKGDSQTSVQTKSNGQNFTPVDCSQISNQAPNNVYSTSSMACRRLSVSSINVQQTPQNTSTGIPQNNETNATLNDPNNPYTRPSNRIAQTQTTQKVREGISKKILRNLFSEADYFEIIKQTDPFIYSSIKEKIKFFSPAFHSMTPEGLNARLTFLNQCTRPGDTLPTVKQVNGVTTLNYTNAVNTAFGAPPVLVLRMGDFYNTKIIPTSLQITYENILDLNPEGIGVQPMIADVTLNFNFIGGMGLKNAVDTIQNALTFNYYANTEIYDERAEATENTDVIDQQLVKRILETRGENSSLRTGDKLQNPGGDTIGVKSNVNLNGDTETGDMSYQKIMDSMLTESQAYINSVLNKSNQIIGQYNLNVLQLVNSNRNYSKGNNASFNSTPISLNIYGKPNNLESQINKLFSDFVSAIENNQIEYLKLINGNIPQNTQKFENSVVQRVKNNLLSFVKSEQPNFTSSLFNIIQETTNLQQSLVQTFAKVDFVVGLSDGYINEKQSPIVYNLTGTTDVTPPPTNGATGTTEELLFDYSALTKSLNNFFTDYSNKVGINTSTNTYDLQTASIAGISDYADKLFFFFLNQRILDVNKRQSLIQTVTNGVADKKSSQQLSLTQVTTAFFESLNNVYSNINNTQKNTLQGLIDDKTYKTFEPYKPGKTRRFTYQQNNQDVQSSQYLLNLYKDGNSNTDNNTYNGKNVFN